MVSLHDQGTMDALRNCGLLNFFRLSSTRQYIRLLWYILHAWDPIDQVFQIKVKSIPFTIKDIYFLMGLSRRGTPLSVLGFARGGESMKDYIHQFYRYGSQPSRDGKINIQDVTDQPLRTIIFTLARLAGSTYLHLVNRSYMQYALEFLEPKVFNWQEVVLPIMKYQLSKVKTGRINNFGYGSILTIFSLERISLMQPQKISLGVPILRKARMQRWVDLMARHAGQSHVSFSSIFFECFDCQKMVFAEYPYVWMDFQGDQNLALPVGEQWSAIGKMI